MSRIFTLNFRYKWLVPITEGSGEKQIKMSTDGGHNARHAPCWVVCHGSSEKGELRHLKIMMGRSPPMLTPSWIKDLDIILQNVMMDKPSWTMTPNFPIFHLFLNWFLHAPRIFCMISRPILHNFIVEFAYKYHCNSCNRNLSLLALNLL